MANTVKHAEGKSALKLRKIRPDLLVNPLLDKYNSIFSIDYHRIFIPLAGEDFYVTVDDLRKYMDAITGFWNELIFAMHENN